MFLCCLSLNFSLVKLVHDEYISAVIVECLTNMLPQGMRYPQYTVIRPLAGCITGTGPKHTNTEPGHTGWVKHANTLMVAKKLAICPSSTFSITLSIQGHGLLKKLLISSQFLWFGTLPQLSKTWNNFTVFAEGCFWSLLLIYNSQSSLKDHKSGCLTCMCKK